MSYCVTSESVIRIKQDKILKYKYLLNSPERPEENVQLKSSKLGVDFVANWSQRSLTRAAQGSCHSAHMFSLLEEGRSFPPCPRPLLSTSNNSTRTRVDTATLMPSSHCTDFNANNWSGPASRTRKAIENLIKTFAIFGYAKLYLTIILYNYRLKIVLMPRRVF